MELEFIPILWNSNFSEIKVDIQNHCWKLSFTEEILDKDNDNGSIVRKKKNYYLQKCRKRKFTFLWLYR